MVSIYDKEINATIIKIAETLKNLIKMPDWAKFVKTGAGKERYPTNLEWWYLRSAAILKSINQRGPIGTNRLKVKYGNKKNRGHKPEHFYKASGKVIRTILQQLEQAELIQQKKDGAHKGRVITSKGRSLLDKA